MVQFNTTCTDEYVEERGVGEDLSAGTFDGNNNRLYMISDCQVITYDVNNGNRGQIIEHSCHVIGLKRQGNLLITLTDLPALTLWKLDEERPADAVGEARIKLPEDYRALWMYDCGMNIYILAQKQPATGAKSLNGSSISSLAKDSSALFRLELAEILKPNLKGGPYIKEIGVELVALTGETPSSAKQMAVVDEYLVKCEGKSLRMIELTKERDKFKKHSRLTSFELQAHFDVENTEMAEFDGVHIRGDTLFATVNVGRVYAWTNMAKFGLHISNSTHITLTSHHVVVAATDRGTLFIGAGNGYLFKYNLTGPSGVGRWPRLEQAYTGSASRHLLLNQDCSVLAALLADNTVSLFHASGLTPIGRIEALVKPPKMSVGILHDPANRNLIVTNGTIGHIQWIDPTNWKTVHVADIAQENIPPEDTFNRPDYLWLDTYLACLTMPRIATCECRKDSANKTYLKFWSRQTRAGGDVSGGKLQLEECFVLPSRVNFVRSAESAQAQGQEFLVISASRQLDMYICDSDKRGRWRRDLARREQSWHSAVAECSTIQRGRFATINVLDDSSHVQIWALDKLRVSCVIDTLNGATQAEWCSRETNILLIVCANGLAAYDVEMGAFKWTILQEGLSLFSNGTISFAYDKRKVYLFDADSGLLEKERAFGRPQKCIVATAFGAGSVCFCGADENGSFSALKPASQRPKGRANDVPAAETEQKQSKKRTAFAQLVAPDTKRSKMDGQQQHPPSRQQLLPPMPMPSIKQFIGGPVYALAPIPQLAMQFVQACLLRRRDSPR